MQFTPVYGLIHTCMSITRLYIQPINHLVLHNQLMRDHDAHGCVKALFFFNGDVSTDNISLSECLIQIQFPSRQSNNMFLI